MRDRDIIRSLVSELMVEAQKPVQQERVRLWTLNNDLRSEKPMVWITEIPFGELEDKVDMLRVQCSDPRLQWLERGLRQKLFTARRLMTDEVVEPVYRVTMALENVWFDVETREKQIRQGAAYIQSHHYEPVIKDFDDIEKIKMPMVRHNAEETFRQVEFYDALFGDIMPIVVTGSPWLTYFTAWDDLVRWTGVTEALIDLTERPDFIHAIMRRMTDSTLLLMTQAEEQGILRLVNDQPRIGSGATGYTDDLPRPGGAAKDDGAVRLQDCWGFATAQIFSDVSPEMHEEFALQYERQILVRAGLSYYGCCEPLHNKMELMKTIPNLRKISVSAWCDVAKTAELAGRRYVFSHKPNPAMLAEDVFNAKRAEQDIRDRLARSGGMPCEIVMKDISTIRGDPQRVIDWCRVAYDVCNR